MINEDLGDGEDGLNREADIAEEGDVGRECAEENMGDREGGGEVEEEVPVGARGAPLPEVVGSSERSGAVGDVGCERGVFEAVFCAEGGGGCPMRL